jgi:hypothetical protein
MKKHNFFVIFLKKINLSINNLLKKYLNKLNLNNFSNIIRSNKFFITFFVLFILFLSYLLIPNIYNKTQITKELKNQLLDKFNLEFNFSQNLKYNFFPRPHFSSIDAVILNNQSEISKIKKLKIYVSLSNLLSLDNIKVNNLILENANFNFNNKNYDFFINLLDKNFKDSTFEIKDSNIFYRNINQDVLFINKIINMKYYYDINDLKNISVSKNKIFNLPYSLELHNNKTEKKIFTKINLEFFKTQIVNEINYSGDIKLGSSNLIFNKNKSNVTYKIKKNSLIFRIFDKLNTPNFSYKGKINFSPFYSSLKGVTDKIDFSSFFKSNALITQLLKTELLNNKNLNFHLGVNASQIQNHESFVNIFLNSKIQEGLIDIDNTKFSWKEHVNFEISDSLIYVNNNELVLDGKLDIAINDYVEIYKFLLTPKSYRTKIKKLQLNFNYNFDKKIISLNNIKINNKLNHNVNNLLKSLIFRGDKLQNKIYLKKIFNEIIKAYAG